MWFHYRPLYPRTIFRKEHELTKATGKPKGRPPGRPKGSRDFRPHLLNLLERFRLIPVLLAELETLRDSLPPEDKVKLYLELARMGLNASPKTQELEGSGPSISLIIGGIRQGPDQRFDLPGKGVVELSPAPLELPPPVDWSAGLPGRKSEISETIRSLKEPPPPPAPGPVFGPPVFTVPTVEEELGPPEWRDPLYPDQENS